MKNIKLIINIMLLTLLGGAIIVFSTLYIDVVKNGFVYKYSLMLKITSIFLAIVLTVLTIIFMAAQKPVIYKSLVSALILILVGLIGLYILEKSGFLDRIDSTADLQKYIAQYGDLAKLMFIFIQFLQVAVIPIPGVITISAGVALFGPLLGGVLSFIGIMIGSMVAFFIGRKLGYKAASWLVGEDDLQKWMTKIKGKDKLILTFMFLFPFFPDDILCFVAGLSTMSAGFFTIMITITRILSIFFVTFSLNGNIIPYNTWWGILIWILIIAICIYVFYLLYQKSDNIQKYINKRKKDKDIKLKKKI